MESTESSIEAFESSLETSFDSRGAAPAVDWGAVVHRHDARLRSRVRRVLCRSGLRPQTETVEEVVQEVYCRLIESGRHRLCQARSSTDPELLSYLGIVAERTTLDHVRVTTAQKRSAVIPIRLLFGRRSRRYMEGIPDPGPTPEQDAIHRERQRDLLERCRRIRGLGSGRRNAWVMRLAVLEGYTSHEIARAAGGRMTSHNVDMLIHRLRRRLSRDGFSLARR
jgi:DNA-directed RNA polymerase specialized sigma24 family protein